MGSTASVTCCTTLEVVQPEIEDKPAAPALVESVPVLRAASVWSEATTRAP
jgi:hypothetical protein